MCGSPTYRFYLGDADQEFICFNCYRIFIQKEKLHPKIMEKKSLQAHEFQKQNHFIGRFLSFFFVGFGDLWRGHPFKGLLLLFLFFIFILRFVYWNGVILLPSTQPSIVGMEHHLLGRSFYPFLSFLHSADLSTQTEI